MDCCYSTPLGTISTPLGTISSYLHHHAWLRPPHHQHFLGSPALHHPQSLPQLWRSRKTSCCFLLNGTFDRPHLDGAKDCCVGAPWRSFWQHAHAWLPILAAFSRSSKLTDDITKHSLRPTLPKWIFCVWECKTELNLRRADGQIIIYKLLSWIRSFVIVAAFSLVWGLRAATAAHYPNLIKPIPVFACVEKERLSSIVKNAEHKQTVDYVGRNSSLSGHEPNRAGSIGSNTESSAVTTVLKHRNEELPSDCKSNGDSSLSQDTSTTTSSELERQGTQDNKDYDVDSEEDYEDEDEDEDDYEEIDENATFEIVNDKEIQGSLATLEDPANTNVATTAVVNVTEKAEENPKFQDDKELQRAFEVWRSKPYKLTVPLRFVGLRGSVPPVWLKDFMLSQGRRVKTLVEYQGGLKEILAAIASDLEKRQVKPRSIIAADLVTVGDSWLRIAVAGGLIEPIKDAENGDWFQRLGSRWQALVRRNDEGHLDSKGKIWGVPYRWGSIVIAYKRDKLAKNNLPPIKDWTDLWRPELAGKIAMVDSPREVVGAVLKSLGASYNTQDLEKDVKGGKQAVKQQFLALQKQVRLFDSVQYLKALGAGEVWVAVGWSSDVIPVAKRMSNMAVIAPESGTSLWADLWAIPAATKVRSDKIGSRIRGPSPLIQQWFDFCLQPARALPFQQGVFVGASPLYLLQDSDSDTQVQTVGDESHHNAGPKLDTNFIAGMPPQKIMLKSEFLEPLSDKAMMDYEWLLSQSSVEQNCPSILRLFIRGIFQWRFGLTQSMGLRH